MGAEPQVISKSSNIDTRMESNLLHLFKEAVSDKDGLDFITKKCQKTFGGSWIMIRSKSGENCAFDMSFAFKTLKWIKFKADFSKYFLFQISE